MTYDAEAAVTPGQDGIRPGPSSSATGGGGEPRRDARTAVGLPAELAEAGRSLFGDRLALAATYAAILATDGVLRGLVGPREAPRIWERHLLNCAAVAELIPPGSSVVDVGSGAGLPGLVLAVARPDLSVALVEPLARRTAFLAEVVAELGLEQSVTVVRGRAEQFAGLPRSAASRSRLSPEEHQVCADIVTARAVAPLDRLTAWCLPLARIGGRVLALKGASAAAEVAEHRDVVHRLGGGPPVVRRCGVGLIDPPTTVVEIVRESAARVKAARRSRPSAGTADGPDSRSARSGSDRPRWRR